MVSILAELWVGGTKEITLLEPRPKLDGHRLIAPIPSNTPVTSPTEAFSNIAICRPRHISATGIAVHLTPKQTDVL